MAKYPVASVFSLRHCAFVIPSLLPKFKKKYEFLESEIDTISVSVVCVQVMLDLTDFFS